MAEAEEVKEEAKEEEAATEENKPADGATEAPAEGDAAAEGGEDEGSMEEILHSIRDIIADEETEGAMAEEEKTEETAEAAEAAATEEAAPAAEEAPAAEGDAAAEGADDDVLELTDVVEGDAAKEGADGGGDVLDDIDAALEEGGDDAAAKEAPAAEEEAPAAEGEDGGDEAAAEPAAEETPAEPAAEETPAEPAAEETTAESAAGDKENLVSDAPAKEAAAALEELKENIPKPDIEEKHFRSGDTVEDLVVETLKPMLSEWLDKNLPIIVEELVQKEIEKIVPRETRE